MTLPTPLPTPAYPQSIDCWLLACMETLQAALGGVDRNRVDIVPEGTPKPGVGEWFVGLDEAGIRGTGGVNNFLREEFDIDATITRRVGRHAADKRWSIYQGQSIALTPIERAVIKAIHGQHTVRVLANTLGNLPSLEQGDAFDGALYYQGRPRTAYKDGTWAGAEPDAAAFLVRTLRFSGGWRVQDLDVMQ